MAERHAVFLVPGFMGFERFENYFYFADRVRVALRAVLEERSPNTFDVDAVTIPPAASLAARQAALASTLASRLSALEAQRGTRIEHVHLVGHSTGAIDSHLLTRSEPLETGRAWSTTAEHLPALRARLRSVTAIAAPFHGTCFAEHPVAKAFAANTLGEWASSLPAAVLWGLPRLGGILGNLATDPETWQVLRGLRSSTEGAAFLRQLAASRDLVDELTPANMASLYQRLGPDPELAVRQRSFVSIAGATPTASESSIKRAKRKPPPPLGSPAANRTEAPAQAPGALFLATSELTASRGTPCATDPGITVARAVERLNQARRDPSRLIAKDPALLPDAIDPTTNDGMVNSARQLFDPSDEDELAGIVVADHYDVIGHYDREAWTYDPALGHETRTYKIEGLLHSGSRFRDDQFLELYRRVAHLLLEAV